MFCCMLLYFHSSFAIILMGEERAGCFDFIFCLPSALNCDCCVALSYGATGLSAVVIVVFPDHTH